ncbi:hypothetical protein TWF225_010661 [Orbilia oligospora]|nr:hypothetical protein TWF225_010661 [Orbilia oligospora]KAF3256924.1 hypothetical protein TWF217_006237 [Orbilia oligospora]
MMHDEVKTKQRCVRVFHRLLILSLVFISFFENGTPYASEGGETGKNRVPKLLDPGLVGITASTKGIHPALGKSN